MSVRSSIQVLLDGRTVPGFPSIREDDFQQLFSITNKITDLVNYKDLLPTFTPTITRYVGLFLLVANQDLFVAFRESAVPNKPFVLQAGRLIAGHGLRAIHTTAFPFLRIKANVNPTTIQAVIGIL